MAYEINFNDIVFNPLYKNIIISTCNECKKLSMRSFFFFKYQVFKMNCVVDANHTSQFGLSTCHALNNHMWLAVTILRSVAIVHRMKGKEGKREVG